ncbi:unnamed protein product [Arctia plantaginis]|uniref:Uncharacterized protein n=1 Tax=Arctia plantaginis TaxID=874455 RepID=A0A8S0ZWP4_ARCPL|nr:unnamed protein product [Arctia plantaginis]CAB3237492.1 unnamed protein product [Arctia plantaginis]
MAGAGGRACLQLRYVTGRPAAAPQAVPFSSGALRAGERRLAPRAAPSPAPAPAPAAAPVPAVATAVAAAGATAAPAAAGAAAPPAPFFHPPPATQRTHRQPPGRTRHDSSENLTPRRLERTVLLCMHYGLPLNTSLK